MVQPEVHIGITNKLLNIKEKAAKIVTLTKLSEHLIPDVQRFNRHPIDEIPLPSFQNIHIYTVSTGISFLYFEFSLLSSTHDVIIRCMFFFKMKPTKSQAITCITEEHLRSRLRTAVSD